jgi:hypothetical protein
VECYLRNSNAGEERKSVFEEIGGHFWQSTGKNVDGALREVDVMIQKKKHVENASEDSVNNFIPWRSTGSLNQALEVDRKYRPRVACAVAHCKV